MAAVVVVASVLIAVMLAIQGAHIIRKGNMVPFLCKPRDTSQVPRLTPFQRYWYGCLYNVPMIGVTIVLIAAFFSTRRDYLNMWFETNIGMLLWLTPLIFLGFALIIKPMRTVRWLLRDKSSLSLVEKPTTFLARVIGLAFILVALAILGSL